MLSSLTALSPLDGRYRAKIAPLAGYASEFALIRYRVRVEVEWLKALADNPDLPEIAAFSEATHRQLEAMLAAFGEADAQVLNYI